MVSVLNLNAKENKEQHLLSSCTILVPHSIKHKENLIPFILDIDL